MLAPQADSPPATAFPQMVSGDTQNEFMKAGAAAPASGSREKFDCEPQYGDERIVVVAHAPGQQGIVWLFAEVLGKRCREALDVRWVIERRIHYHGCVVGVPLNSSTPDLLRDEDRNFIVTIYAHCVDAEQASSPSQWSATSDYEFRYLLSRFSRSDITRFSALVLGQIDRHGALLEKPRSTYLTTTFSDIRVVLNNIDVLTVGADAIELRVDLLRDRMGAGAGAGLAAVDYVGDQVMLLRQRTDLPIIYTIRSRASGGAFSLESHNDLYQFYLRKAIQWGVDYIDVDMLLRENLRQQLQRMRANTKIIASFHNLSGEWQWLAPEAELKWSQLCSYGDVVKMVAALSDPQANFELECFRTKVQHAGAAKPLSAINISEAGKVSHALNRFFTPITHPLLSAISEPGQMTVEELNWALSALGKLPERRIYGIGCSSQSSSSASSIAGSLTSLAPPDNSTTLSSFSFPSSSSSSAQAPFFHKCFNELGLRQHCFTPVLRHGSGAEAIEPYCKQYNFGGAYLSPPIAVSKLTQPGTFFGNLHYGRGPLLTEAARTIGMIDTIVAQTVTNPLSSPAAVAASSPPPPTISSTSVSPTISAIASSNTVATNFGLLSPLPSTVSTSPATPPTPTTPPNTVSGQSAVAPGIELVLENIMAKAIVCTLTRDFAPSAFCHRAAVVVAPSATDAASVLYALSLLRITRVHSVGFTAPPALAARLVVEPCASMADMQRLRNPRGNEAALGGDDEAVNFPTVLISALAAEQCATANMFVRCFAPPPPESSDSTDASKTGNQQIHTDQRCPSRRMIFLDTAADAARRPAGAVSPANLAHQLGYQSYGVCDLMANKTVLTMRLLAGQNVPWNFVRLACPSGG